MLPSITAVLPLWNTYLFIIYYNSNMSILGRKALSKNNSFGWVPEPVAYPLKMIPQLTPISESAEDHCANIKKGIESWGRKRTKSGGAATESPQKEKKLRYTIENSIQTFHSKREGCRCRASPLGLISSVISCWFTPKAEDKNVAEQESTSALVELSRRQQEALGDKQDTIDMLEWQLEQLQIIACKEHELDITATTEIFFEMGIVRTTLAIRYFCRVFMKQMEVSGYSVGRTIADMDPQITFLRKEHTAFALEARINKALFHCFENESFDDTGLTKILDPAKRSIVRMEDFKRMKNVDVGDAINPSHASFEPEFLKFCESKTREMWALFPWNIVFRSTAERASFSAAFLDAAKVVWLLHKLAFAMNPVVSIFRVERGMEANHLYVDPVAVPDSFCRRCHSSKVEFMIMPGFRRLGLIKCQVYLHIRCK
ncbi:hypothetical protein O6H91_17G052200 [Diphasiastrum complanatum]|uniref:Uncharacterized protein n=1 Tax=Diphasiastrum complanatum TaxID=34168 RepID=A0ACC2B7V3_DIPCM|nr:hypothetical protein O6H91_17G052200 [Diphasiastrum complanatum]